MTLLSMYAMSWVFRETQLLTLFQPGHEYTKANVKFAASVSSRDAVQNLHSFAENNKITTGKFTIGDEKVCQHIDGSCRRTYD